MSRADEEPKITGVVGVLGMHLPAARLGQHEDAPHSFPGLFQVDQEWRFRSGSTS
jgi:hypothetical protein